LQSVFGPRGPRRHSGVSVAKHSRQRRSEFGFFLRCFFASYAVKSGSFPWNFTSVTPPPSFPTDGMMLGGVVVVRMEEEDSGLDVEKDFGGAPDEAVGGERAGGVVTRLETSRRNFDGSESDAGLTK
jgi:hypothetical protein